MTPTPDKTAIRDAATIIVVRDRQSQPSVLMGQRGSSAAFMPNKYVFPGGAVDDGDANIPLARPMLDHTINVLAQESLRTPQTLAAAAIRELWEETGQILGLQSAWPDAPNDWHGFAQAGYRPDAVQMQYFFRAITPKGRPRRFDARFFLVDADHLMTDLDDFSDAEDELSHLHWVPLADARSYDLPFITEVVLAELSVAIADPTAPLQVPFFRNDDERHLISRLNGKSPLDL